MAGDRHSCCSTVPVRGNQPDREARRIAVGSRLSVDRPVARLSALRIRDLLRSAGKHVCLVEPLNSHSDPMVGAHAVRLLARGARSGGATHHTGFGGRFRALHCAVSTPGRVVGAFRAPRDQGAWRRGEPGAGRPECYRRAATASISTLAPFGSAATWTVARAGASPSRHDPYASFTRPKSPRSVR